MGYPSVSGRLHTRYSPVRRSPSKYCYFMLPLDLHVLSLSLAFILSQDQTLHTKIFLQKYFSYAQLCSDLFFRIFWTRTCCSFIFSNLLQYLKELFLSCFLTLGFSTESGCKDKAFYQFNPNFFELFFKKYSKENRNQIEKYRSLHTPFQELPRKSMYQHLLESGCKSRPFHHNFQIFLHVFSRKN